MEALAVQADFGAGAGAGARGGTEAEAELLDLSKSAWQLAVRVLRSQDGAEDVVQQAYLEAVAQIRAGGPPREARAWFLRVVAHKAQDHLKGEARRRRREAAVASERDAAVRAPGATAEEVELLRRALDELDDKYRLPVSLCYEQGLSQREAAAVLEIPESTMSKYLGVGLERLRAAMEKGGCAATVAAVLGGLKLTAPSAPATLTAGIAKLLAGGLPAAKGTAAAAGSAALKGGLLVKIGLTVAAAGLMAGGVFWAVGGKSEESAKPKAPSTVEGPAPAAEKAPGKDYPYGEGTVYRRQVAVIGSMNSSGGYQDGPGAQLELTGGVLRAMAPNGDWYMLDYEMNNLLVRYDARKKRSCTIAWGGPIGKRGGPAECARFRGGGYAAEMSMSVDPSGKFLVIDDANNGCMWQLDLEKLVIEPTAWNKGSVVCATAPDGSVCFAGQDGKLKIRPPDGKTIQETGVTLEGPLANDYSYGREMANLKLGRIYASALRLRPPAGPWGLVWYWDMKTGKATGVAGPKKGETPDKQFYCASGPADKVSFWCPLGISLGPDRGERYVYVGGGDESTISRIDLEKNYVTKMVHADAKDRSLWTFGEGRQQKDYRMGDPYSWPGAPIWGRDGEFYMCEALCSAIDLYTPVQK